VRFCRDAVEDVVAVCNISFVTDWLLMVTVRWCSVTLLRLNGSGWWVGIGVSRTMVIRRTRLICFSMYWRLQSSLHAVSLLLIFIIRL